MSAIETSVNSLPTYLPPSELSDKTARPFSQLSEMQVASDRDATSKKTVLEPLVWKAATLKSASGHGAEEKEFGADILGVLTIDLPNYKVAKGFLAQAKRAEPNRDFSSTEWRRLQGQCRGMLNITPDAFVMAYSKLRGVRLFSAEAVASYNGRNLFELYDASVRTFFEKHLESFIGDRRLNTPHLDVVRHILRERDGDRMADDYVLHLKGRQAE